MNQILSNSGLCEVCGIPQETLFLDSGKLKCSLCCNPQLIKKSRFKISQNDCREVLQ